MLRLVNLTRTIAAVIPSVPHVTEYSIPAFTTPARPMSSESGGSGVEGRKVYTNKHGEEVFSASIY